MSGLQVSVAKRIISIYVGDTNLNHVSYSLNSFKGVIHWIMWGSMVGLIKGNTRSLDNGSYC